MSAPPVISKIAVRSLSFWQFSVQRQLKMLCLLAAFALPVIQVEAGAVSSRVGLDGYDPTAAIDDHELVKGKSARSAKFDGVIYHFASRESRSRFLRSPQKYVPAFGGDCTVCYAKSGERVPGSIRYSSLHNDRLFLFPGKAEKAEFVRNSHLYENTDLVADGDSVVWLLRGQRRLAGSPQYSETYRGFRYQFASSRDQFEFRRNRARYANLIMNFAQQAVTNILPSAAQQLSALGTVGGGSAGGLQSLTALQRGQTEALDALTTLEMAHLEPPRPPISIN